MKTSITLLIAILSCLFVTAQVRMDNTIKNGVILPADDNKETTTTPYKLNLKKDKELPEIDLKNPLEDPVVFSIEKDTDLLDAGEELEKRWKDSDLTNSAKADQYLGDFKTKSAYLTLQCRDFGTVDGDYVRIILNDQVVRNSWRLGGGFKGINIDLEPGLNRIDIIAINVGMVAPNTGHFVVVDDLDKIINNQMWNLYAKGKATMIVIKE